MKSKSMKIVELLVVILLIAGSVLGYLYLGTDVFKSNKDRFYKYLAQNKEITQLIEDDLIKEYELKKTKSAYENNGDIKLNSNLGDSSADDVLKDIKVAFDGKINNKDKKVQENLKLSYQSEELKMTYVEDGDKYAVKSEQLGNEFFGFENNNLKELAKKLGISDTSIIPDKISLDELQKELFTEEELKQIYNNYKDILVNSFDDSNFTKVTDNNQEGYKLTITDTKFLEVATKLFEKLKDDKMILEKIEKYSSESITVDDLQKEIAEMIESIKDEKTENKDIMYITVYTDKGKTTKTVIEIVNKDTNVLLNMTLTKSDNNAKFEVTADDDGDKSQIVMEFNKEKQGNDLKNVISLIFKIDNEEVKVEANAEYNNIKGLQDVTEKINLLVSYKEDNETKSIDMTYTNENKFVNSVETESLSSAKLLNDYSEEEIQNLLLQFSQVMKGTKNLVNNFVDTEGLGNLTEGLNDDIEIEEDGSEEDSNDSEDVEEAEEIELDDSDIELDDSEEE